MSLHLFDPLAQTEVSFYLPLSEASPAESGAQHSLPSRHQIASAFQGTKKGQWGEDEGHLPPAMTFLNVDPSNSSFCRKCSSAHLQPV